MNRPSEQQIVREIIAYFKDEIVNDGALVLKPEDEIIRQGLIDSMGIVRLMTHLQGRYGIKEFDRSDIVLDNFRTIATIGSMVARYVEVARPSAAGCM